MTTDFRALCVELITFLHDAADDVEGWGNYASDYFQVKHDLTGNIPKIHAQADRARTALAQPEPPADGEVAELVAWLRKDGALLDLRPAVQVRILRAADILERLAVPEPVGPTDEELHEMWRSSSLMVTSVDFPRIARAVLTRWGP